MIDTLLGKIAGFFEKDFLFGSFLPALLFAPLVLATFAFVLGAEAVNAAWLLTDAWTVMQKAVFATLAGFAVVVFAYLLHALRRGFAMFWSGTLSFPLLWGFWRLGEEINKRSFRRLKARSDRISLWRDESDFFMAEVKDRWDKGTLLLPDDKRDELMLVVSELSGKLEAKRVRVELGKVIDAYDVYPGNELGDVYQAAKNKLDELHEQEAMRIQTDTSALDRRYGSLETIKATALGNVIESYNQYSSKRYKIEAEIFWPRLRAVIKPEYFELVEGPRILMDFSLTTASLGLVYGLLALLAGPWLWYNPLFWGALALAGFLISYFFYRLGVSAAYQLGEMVRACFDLFRLDLMTVLSRPHPATFDIEKRQWEELSQLAVYGEVPDFELSERKGDA